ncbi:SH3 domain-containing protein, partial [Chloroflexota bacterium]
HDGTSVCASLPQLGGVALLSGGTSAPAAAVQAPAAVEETATVGTPVSCMVTTTYRVNLRDAPNGAEITRIPYETTLTASAESGGWYQVDWLGQSGWVSADYVTATCQ